MEGKGAGGVSGGVVFEDLMCFIAQNPVRWPSTARFGEWPAWLSFWFSGCWRALAKGTAWAFFIAQFTINKTQYATWST